jgi:cytochrome c
MSTLEVNKFIGAILVGGLVMMVTGIMGHMLVNPKLHGGEGTAISGGEGGGGTPAAPAPAVIEPVTPLLAKADPAKGKQTAMACTACHDFSKGGPNKIGPNLWGIVGSKPAEVPGFAFSDAMKAREDKPWTYEALNEFLTAPRNFVPGTKMTFAGLPKIQDRANVIAFLRTLSDNPVPPPSEADVQAAEKAYEKAKTAAAKPAANNAAVSAPAAGGTQANAGAPAAQPTAQTGTGAAGTAAAPIAARLKSADANKGAEISKKCMACHTFAKGGPNKIGPNLWGIVGSKPAEVPGYAFSDAMKGREDKPWTYEALDQFLTSPRNFVPGTKMTFAGLPKPQDRADLIAWLRQQSDSPVPLP